MKKTVITLACILLSLMLCLPAWADEALPEEAGAALPEDIPAFDPASLIRFEAPEPEEEAFIACAEALWASPLFWQDLTGVTWEVESNDTEYGEPVVTLHADLPDDAFVYAAISLKGEIRHVTGNFPEYYEGERQDVALSGQEYTPQELRAIADPTPEEKILLFFLNFTEAIEPETVGRIEKVYVGCGTEKDGVYLVECWAETPDMPGDEIPGGSERTMEIVLAPEFKVLTYGPSRG